MDRKWILYLFRVIERKKSQIHLRTLLLFKNGLGPPVKNYLHNLNSDFCTSGKKKQLVGIRGTIIKD